MTPAQALSQVQGLAWTLGKDAENIVKDSAKALGVGEVEGGFAKSLATVLKQSHNQVVSGNYDVVLWNNAIRQAAIQGAEAFEGEIITPDSLPQVNCWWVYDEPLAFHAKDYPDLEGWDVDHGWYLEAHYVYPSDRFVVNPYEKSGYSPVQAHGLIAVWSDGNRLRVSWEPGIPYGEPMPHHLAAVVAMQQFLTLPFLEIGHIRPNHEQRKLAKKYRRPEPPAVKVILLRRKEHSEHGTGEGSREYHCQWLVSGHWRRLHKPRKDGVRVVYISPHVKGPEGMPLLPPRQSVYAAVR